MPGTTGLQGGIAGAVIAGMALALGQQTPPLREQAASDPAPAPAAGQTATPPKPLPGVALVDGSVLEVTRPDPGDSVEVRVLVSSREPGPVGVAFQLALTDSATGRDGSSTLSRDTATVGGPGVNTVRLRVRAGGAGAAAVEKGYLTLMAPGENALTPIGMHPIRIAPPAEAPRTMTWILGISFSLALVTVAGAWARRPPHPPSTPLPWSGDSWASNLTVGGSVLVAFTGFAAPAATFQYMTRAQYASLATLLSGVVVLASAIYAFTRPGPAGDAPEAADPFRWHLGRVRRAIPLGVVLVATMGAALAQLATLGLLVREARGAAVLPHPVYLGTNLVVAVAIAALWAYAFRLAQAMGAGAPPERDALPAPGAWHLP